MKKFSLFIVCVAFVLIAQLTQASKLVEIKVVDKDYLLVYFKDGDVTFNEDLKFLGANAYTHEQPWFGKE